MSEHVLVIGAGTMGAGIAQLCAQRGRAVTLVDVDDDRLLHAKAVIRRSLDKLSDKRKLKGRPSTIIQLLHLHADPEGAPPPGLDIDVVVEAVPEDVALKARVLAATERAVGAETLMASNTSSIPVGRLADNLQHPERLLGLHFFNPAVLMRVVEVVRGPQTSDATFERATKWIQSLGHEALRVERDVPGFLLNRIAMTASNEAIRLVQQGVGTATDIDRGVKAAFGWRMGPLETADLVGLDVVLAARQQIFEQTGDARFEPPRLLRELVEKGYLGRKTGRGFYRHKS